MLLISLQKLFLFSRYLSFYREFLVMQQNGLNRKIRLISGFMTSQLDCQTIAIHIFPNISRSKDNQTMTFSQLIENDMRNIFLEKSYSNCRGETSPRPFSVKLKLTISLERQSKVLYSLFLLYPWLRAIEIY